MRLDDNTEYIPVQGVNVSQATVEQPTETTPVPSPWKLVTIAILISLLAGTTGAIVSLAVAKPIINKIQGEQGQAGLSAYQVAIENGYEGSEEQWIASLKGDKGSSGPQGLQGLTGSDGKNGTNGKDGVVANLSSIPGWPANCNTPQLKNITAQVNGVDTPLTVLACN